MKLKSALAVAAIKKVGDHAVGQGLYLRVTRTGARAWLLRYQRGGHPHKMGLGAYQAVTLAEAREKAHEAKRLLAQGADPIAQRKRATSTSMTFQTAADQFIADKGEAWAPKTEFQWRSSLKQAYKHFGRLPVAEVSIEHVDAALRPIWTKTPETGRKLRGRIENVLDWATARRLRTGENPARMKVLKHVLPQQTKEVGHFAAMPYAEVPVFMHALEKQEGMGALALRFAILTAARSGEVRGMTWGEVDFDDSEWTVPAQRMKGKRVHRVPLSKGVVSILRQLRKLGRGPLVFESMKRGKPISEMTLTAVLRRMNIGVTAHGFRSSFRDWCGDNGHPRELAEAALAHLSGDAVERAYARSDLFMRREKLMASWDRFCRG